ncbi:MAG: hypothetical protein KDE51_23210, partial [Anaerolineales bacterium]|nr:hypothetical protein [Anaerolineales bacterium]
MRRIASLILLIIVAAIALAPSAYRYWSYYEILPWERQPERPAPPSFSAEEVADVIKPEQGEFVDEPEMGEGLILLDVAHDNQFQLEEIGPLDGRLAARGYEFINYTGGDLSRQLRGVSAFVAIAPLEDYGQDEIEALTDFVARGGRLLMMGDPARFDVEYIEDDFGFIVDFRFNTNEIPLNSLANEFDLTFEGDYLYDLTRQNEGNFRNIVIEDDHMSASPLTDNLDAVALYGSHSIRVGSQGETLLAGSDNVYSSATDRAGGLSLAAVSHDNQVMAIGDINFMGEPYFASLDNMRFIANIADFLVGGAQRDYLLTDFPYFYQEQIDLLYIGDVDLGADAFDEIIVLQDGFREAGKKLTLTTEPQEAHDTLYLGLYNQANTETIAAMLEAAGITLVIEPPVLTEDELQAIEEA